MNIYDFKATAQNGSEISLSDYKGKVLLIVNTATECGFTPQYEDLQKLYDDHHKDGFEILDFPCNQFDQAPGSDEEIHNFCTIHYNTTFPQFSKIDVNGENALPLYHYLTKNTKFEGFGTDDMGIAMSEMLEEIDENYQENSSIKWNFTKFLIDRSGNISARFEPTASMDTVAEKVKSLL